jgi:Fe-S-cluster containining protein
MIDLTMRLDELFKAYESVLELVDQEFDRNMRRHAGRMQCQKGCSSCCSQMFPITALEAAYIWRAVKHMDAPTRQKFQARARIYLKERQRMLDQREKELDPDEPLTVIGLRLPCPALENDVCQIYGHRPMVCHKFGMPLYNPRRPDQLQACHLNFHPGEAIEDDQLIPQQTKIYERWQEVKEQVKRYTEHATSELPVVTVAEALLYDFEALLQEKMNDE